MSTLTEYGFAQDGKIYLNAYMDFPQREIGVVRESEETSLQYFVNRFELARKKVEDLKEAVESTPNKGSYLMKLIHMRTYLAEFDGLGDFPSLFAMLDTLEQDIRIYIQENRVKNLEIKRSILLEAEELKDNSNWNVGALKFKELKLRWIKTGSAVDEHEQELNDKFDEAYNLFFERRTKFYEEKRQIIDQRIGEYEALLQKIVQLTNDFPENALPQLKSYQNEWRNIGKIPKKRFQALNDKLRLVTNQFFGKLKRTRSAQPVVPQNPIDVKKDLCERVEKMLNSNYEPSIDQVKKIQNEWKKLGKLKHNMDREYNTRFKIACNEIFESHFLTKTARTKYESFDDKTKFEQLKIKIRLLKESIKEDEAILSKMNEKDGTVRYGGSPSDDNRPPIDLEKLNQINKLKTKQRILKKLQDQLLANY